MKKRSLLILVIFLIACTEISNDESQHTEDDFQIPMDYQELERNLDELLKLESMIGPDHYDTLKAAVDALAKNEDVSELIEKLSQLDVAPRDDSIPTQEYYPENIQEFDPLQAVMDELDNAIAQGFGVSGEHADRIQADIDGFEEQGIDVSELRQKLQQARQQSEPYFDEVGAVLEEMNNIIAQGSEITQSHYDRLVDDINRFETQGKDVTDLKTKLEQINELLESPKLPDLWDFKSKLPDCTDQKYTVAPIDMNDLMKIFPRGGINPPGHTIPTDHGYLFVSVGQQSTKMVPLSAPGDIYITSIDSDTDDIVPERTEYVIWFSLCKDLHGYYNHVKELSDEMHAILADVECEAWDYNPAGICSKKIFQKIDAGTIIAEVGHKQGNFDFGSYDHRMMLDFANKYRYGIYDGSNIGPRTLHMDCPYDHYTEPLKTQLYDKIVSNRIPKCGLTMLDIPGTLQGNWFFGQSAFDDPSTWQYQVAFVPDPADKDISIVSIAGHFTDTGKWEFTPKTSGTTNRDFSQTKTGEIYCYEADSKTGRIIVELLTSTQLKIEHQSGSCGGTYTFNSPVIYER